MVDAIITPKGDLDILSKSEIPVQVFTPAYFVIVRSRFLAPGLIAMMVMPY